MMKATKMSHIYKILTGFALAATMMMEAQARPISYPGGWTVMQRNTGDASSAHAHYSPTFKDSIGIYAERNWTEDKDYVGVQYNRLLKRWNAVGSQANIYAKTSLGLSQDFVGKNPQLAGFVGVAADWETRRWFTSYEAGATQWGQNETTIFQQTARLGVAPYIGDYGDLHTWLMVEFENNAQADDALTVTPILRLFYDVQLLELGYTPQTEEFTVNWIVRF